MVLTLIIARRVTPAGSPAMAVVFMLGCLVHWRVGASRIQALVSREAVSQAAATPSEPPKLAPAAPDRDAVAQMVHDLRSPLSAVLALVDKQGADKAEAVHHDFLRSVRDQVQYGLSVAQHFMQRSRAERLDRSRFLPVSLQDLAHSAADQVLPLADKKGVSIDVRDGDETLWVAGDYCMLVARRRQSAGERRQVFGFRHAGHAGRAADGQCRASVRGGPGRGHRGRGLARLCQAFYRAAGARRHCQDGVGMGLAIVAAVAKGHGAEVMVKSRPSQGSTFILTMPLLPRGARKRRSSRTRRSRKARRSGW